MNNERSNNLATQVIINTWVKSIRAKETNMISTQLYPECNNLLLLGNVRRGSICAYNIIQAGFWERDIGVMDIVEWDICETVGTCRFTKQLLIHIHIPEVSSCLSFSQYSHRWARFLQCHISQIHQPTEEMSLCSWWLWERLWWLWLGGWCRRLWL